MERLKPKVGVLIREVSKNECPWLDRGLIKGTAVFLYTGPIWQCITDSGIAVTLDPNEEFPFVEIPLSAVIWDKE